MEFIYLGRSLDQLAKSDNYRESPDDITKLVLSYTGNIKAKSTMMFKISFQFSYDHYNSRWVGAPGQQTRVETLFRAGCLGYKDFVYCAYCRRTYAGEGSINNHVSTKLHQDNLNKATDFKNTLVVKQFFIKNMKTTRRKNCKLNKKTIFVKEVFDIPYQYHD